MEFFYTMILSNFFICLVATLSALQQQHLIDWSATRKLTWDDFKATPRAGSTNAALTSSSINMEFGYDDNSIQFSIRCRFDKNRSWVRVRNAAVLAHEQGHFDIAELHARKLNKAFRAYQFNYETVSKDVNGIYDKVMALHQEYQQQYDQGTDYSRNKEKQAAWLKKIAAELKALENFADYRERK